VLAPIGWNLTSLRTSNKATCWLNQTVGTVLHVLALLGPSCISGLLDSQLNRSWTPDNVKHFIQFQRMDESQQGEMTLPREMESRNTHENRSVAFHTETYHS
jgi:hypothetical protein